MECNCEIGPNKQSQILLALRSKEKFRCCIPPSSVNSGLLPLKMHIWVDNRVLYVSVHQKMERFHVELSFWPYNILNSFPGKVCVLSGNHPRFAFFCLFILGR